MLQRNEADVAASYLTNTPQRQTVVDFTITLNEEVTDLVIRKEKRVNSDFMAYLNLLAFESWIGTSLFIFIMASMLKLMVMYQLDLIHHICILCIL